METKMIEYARADGKKAPGYLEMPIAGEDAPAVVVIQEWWGLNPQIKAVADKLAKAGYRKLVPELLRVKIAKDKKEANHLSTTLDWGSALLDIRGAGQHLKSFAPSKGAVIGFCMGGALTVMAGVKSPEFDAGVCFYGIPPVDAAAPTPMRLPIEFPFATIDDCTNPPPSATPAETLWRRRAPYE